MSDTVEALFDELMGRATELLNRSRTWEDVRYAPVPRGPMDVHSRDERLLRRIADLMEAQVLIGLALYGPFEGDGS